MIKLRPYQQEFVSAVWSALLKKKTALAVMPCGTGKTEAVMGLCKRAIELKPDMRIMFVIDTVKLVAQTAKRFETMFSPEMIGTYCGSLGEKCADRQITIASVQSIHKADVDLVNLLVVDECQKLSNEEDSQYQKLIRSLSSKNDRFKIVGLTATPYRASGYIFGDGQLFDCIDYQVGLQWAIKEGFLVPPVMKCPNHQFDTSNVSIVCGDYDSKELAELAKDEIKIRKQIEDAMPRIAGRKKVVWACVGIDHAELVSRMIPEPSAIVHSRQSQDEQAENLDSFENGQVRHLVFVTMLATGYDYPPIDAIVFMRPTRSPTLYVQTVGRALRLSPGKVNALIVDYGGVVMNCGPLDNPRVPKKGERKGQSIESLVKACPGCLSFIPTATMICPDCGYEYPKKQITKSLTDKASDARALLSVPEWVKVRAVEVGKITSKAGNMCLKITYFPVNIISSQSISEFFVWNNQWAQDKARRRLIQLGIPFDTDINNVVKSPIKRRPVAVMYKYENKYPRILDMSFHDGEGNRVSNSASDQFNTRSVFLEK